MPQLLIDTDTESVETLRDTILLLSAIATRKAAGQDVKTPERAVGASPLLAAPFGELSPSVFAGNAAAPIEVGMTVVGEGIPEGTKIVALNDMPAPTKPKRTRAKRTAAEPATTSVPLPPIVAEAPTGNPAPTITPAIAARIAEAGGAPPPPPPPPLTLVGETPPVPAGPTFRDVMLVITQGLQSGKLTNAEVVEVCKRQGIDGPTSLPAQPMLNGPVLAGLKMLLATKG